MDPLTQGIVGGIFATGLARKNEIRVAALAGALAAMLADLDVLITRPDDPLFSVLIHRHFSHALFFIPIGGLIGALLLWPFCHRHFRFGRLLRFTIAGYATAGILDACTSYGTYLYWPFSDQRVAWDLVSIIDPVFTGMLILTMVLALLRKHTRPAHLGVVFMLVYLGLGLIQRERAINAIHKVAAARGQIIERVSAKPTLFNLLLWRVLYETEDRIFVDAVRLAIGSPQIIAGRQVSKLNPGEMESLVPPDSAQAEDIKRFIHFADGWVAWHPMEHMVMGDLRYGMLPHSINPIWGIRLNPQQPDHHAPFIHLRHANREMLLTFFRMLGGKHSDLKEAS